MRTYKRKAGSRPYRNYTKETLDNAARMIVNKEISIRNAVKRFNIPHNTLFRKTQQLRGGKPPASSPGGQKVFSTEEENRFVVHAIAMPSYGFPITTFDLRCLVKSYLDKTGRIVPCFKKGNFPGREWALSFMARHKNVLSQRLSKNISYARAANDEEVLDIFFKKLEEEGFKDIPPENQWNYDETNLQDDPGSRKVITRKGSKYPEQIQNSSKASTSIMVCGNAAGETLPLYVVYKSEMWTTWTENGPEGTRYNRSKSGWFDHNTFEDCFFFSLALPRLKRQPGKKALIGDNLCSHISLDVLKACEENDIKFIALPPNATHLLQPLDVAYFRPMKVQWRKILTEWKKSPSGSRCMAIPKDEFPGLLKLLMNALAPESPNNLKSGFRKTGIYPLNKMEVLQRLPESVLESSLGSMTDCVSDVFINELRKRREEVTQRRAPKRRKKVNVQPGKSITSADLEQASTANEPSTSTGRKENQKQSSKSSQKKSRKEVEVEDTDDSDDAKSLRESENTSGEESFTSLLERSSSPTSSTNSEIEENGVENEPRFKVGDYVVVDFESKLYPGKVTVVRPGRYMVSVMTRSGKHWRWPAKKDEILYSAKEVLYQINAPEKADKRGLFVVKEID